MPAKKSVKRVPVTPTAVPAQLEAAASSPRATASSALPEQRVEHTAAGPARYVAPEAEPAADPQFERKLRKYIERTEKDIEKLTERHALSGQEFDKQIVALAGGGLALSITLVKDFLNNQTDLLWLLFASWSAFLLALTANLISHRTSTTHYNLMIERQKHYLDCSEADEETDIDEALDKRLAKQIGRRTKWVNGLNLGALITCLLGITFFVIFTFYNKYYAPTRTGPTAPAATARLRPGPYQRALGNDGATSPTPAAPGARLASPLPAAGNEVKTPSSLIHEQAKSNR